MATSTENESMVVFTTVFPILRRNHHSCNSPTIELENLCEISSAPPYPVFGGPSSTPQNQD
eukprot:2230748-Amphidinium_carterae.1